MARRQQGGDGVQRRAGGGGQGVVGPRTQAWHGTRVHPGNWLPPTMASFTASTGIVSMSHTMLCSAAKSAGQGAEGKGSHA